MSVYNFQPSEPYETCQRGQKNKATDANKSGVSYFSRTTGVNDGLTLANILAYSANYKSEFEENPVDSATYLSLHSNIQNVYDAAEMLYVANNGNGI